jgi:tRNA pseudouridine38-40 synthase
MADVPTRNILLTVQYDGTDFSGWQIQPVRRTVQAELGRTIEGMVGHPVELWASSRTDAGVHARAMPVSFETTRDIPEHGFLRGLNATLPPDISVTSVAPFPLGVRPRDVAVAKTYRYRVQLGPRRALGSRFAWWPRQPRCDVAAMREAAALFLGEHDFTAFRSVHCDSKTTRRTIHEVELGIDGDELLTISITGNAFLRNMVRVMAGSLVSVGLGRRQPRWVKSLLATGMRDDAAQTAPAQGLTLHAVHFDGYPRIGKPPLEGVPAADTTDSGVDDDDAQGG